MANMVAVVLVVLSLVFGIPAARAFAKCTSQVKPLVVKAYLTTEDSKAEQDTEEDQDTEEGEDTEDEQGTEEGGTDQNSPGDQNTPAYEDPNA